MSEDTLALFCNKIFFIVLMLLLVIKSSIFRFLSYVIMASSNVCFFYREKLLFPIPSHSRLVSCLFLLGMQLLPIKSKSYLPC